MKHSYIAKRFQSSAAGLSLDTEALAKYKDIIDLHALLIRHQCNYRMLC